jgi:hypothetical protein
MTRARLDGLYFLLLGSLVFLLLGVILENASPVPMVDFRVLYYPAHCLIQHGDPYNEKDVQRISLEEGGAPPWDTEKVRQVVTQYLYPPTSFSITIPFAMLPWGIAHLLWMTFSIGSLIFASFLIWDLGANYAPILSGALIGFLLANSELLVITGNAAGISDQPCAWWPSGAFFARRYFFGWRPVPCNQSCHQAARYGRGLAVFFLLAGGVYRKRALQSLLRDSRLESAGSSVGLAWSRHNWVQELAFQYRGVFSARWHE